ncbi:MAG: hypothetical protein ABI378_08850, partial [Chitinophagaceae bacterium]
MKTNFIHKLTTVVFAFVLLFGATAQAQTPTYAYAPTSVGTNVFPLGNASSNFCQWLYQPGDFSPTPPGGLLITTIYIKSGNAYSSGGTFTNLSIKIGTTSLSCLSSGTWNTGLTTVYSNASASIASWTTNGWVAFTLQTQFYYSGTSNIILEITQSGFTNPMYLQQGTFSGCNRRMYGSSTSASSTGADGSCLSFGFDAVPAACSGTPSAPTVVTPPFPPTAPLCAGSTTTLTASNPNFGTGISFQWQISSGGSTGPWANVTNGSGATTLSYTTGAVLAPTYYRMGVTCSNSNLTTYSAPYYLLTGAPIPS